MQKIKDPMAMARLVPIRLSCLGLDTSTEGQEVLMGAPRPGGTAQVKLLRECFVTERIARMVEPFMQ